LHGKGYSFGVKMQNYNFTFVSFLVLITYFGSVFLVKFEKIDRVKQRRFWNTILLASFLISGILGLILAFLIDQKLSIKWYLPMLWWHVETGIIMAIVSIFHFFWHLKYFEGICGKRKKYKAKLAH